MYPFNEVEFRNYSLYEIVKFLKKHQKEIEKAVEENTLPLSFLKQLDDHLFTKLTNYEKVVHYITLVEKPNKGQRVKLSKHFFSSPDLDLTQEKLKKTMSKAYLNEIFHLVRNFKYFSWELNDYCNLRADLACKLLAASGVNPAKIKKIFVAGKLIRGWHFHIAAAVEHQNETFVFDPSLNDEKILLVQDWLNLACPMQNKNARLEQLPDSSPPYPNLSFEANVFYYKTCSSDQGLMNDNGQIIEDPFQDDFAPLTTEFARKVLSNSLVYSTFVGSFMPMKQGFMYLVLPEKEREHRLAYERILYSIDNNCLLAIPADINKIDINYCSLEDIIVD